MMRIRPAYLLFVLLLVEIPAGLKAQPSLNVAPGAHVRLRTGDSSSWLVGIYRGRSADSLRIVLSGEPEPRMFRLADIRVAEVSGGRFRHVRKGARIGAAVGAGVGLVAVIFSTGGEGAADIDPVTFLVAVGVMTGAGAAAGALSGLVMGFTSVESWEPVSPRGWTAGDTAASFRVGYRFRF